MFLFIGFSVLDSALRFSSDFNFHASGFLIWAFFYSLLVSMGKGSAQFIGVLSLQLQIIFWAKVVLLNFVFLNLSLLLFHLNWYHITNYLCVDFYSILSFFYCCSLMWNGSEAPYLIACLLFHHLPSLILILQLSVTLSEQRPFL